MTYRKDVQMLRGVAVLLVVLFHLGFGAFGSGFLGVDVFFVISGYLMGVMYRPGDKAGFFSRRAKRLLPAYFATVAATVLAALAITTPSDFGQVAEQARFATVFAPNIGFWLGTAYFDKAAFKPLLHLWSLGVELQFYALVPLLYWALKKTRAAGYAALVLTTVAACFYILGASPKTSFFWMPLRLWEFLFGFGVASYLASGRPVPRLPWVGAAGFLLILLIPVLPVDGNVQNALHGHPGVTALAICSATSLVLLLGLPAPLQLNPVATGLERLGDWSYSVYLAHFPVIVLALYQPFAGPVLTSGGPLQLAGVAALVVLASAALYRLVERPLRHGPLRTAWMFGAVFGVLALSAVGGLLQNMLLPATERAIYAAWEDRGPYRCGKIIRVLHPRAKSCEITPPIDAPKHRILLVGNSHADSIKDAFAEAAAAQRAAVYFTVSNAPLMGEMSSAAVIEEAVARKADALVLHFSPGAVASDTVAQVVQLARERGIEAAYVLPVPVWEDHIPRMLWAAAKRGQAPAVQTLQQYQQANAGARAALAQIPELRLYEVAPLLCAPACRMIDGDGSLLYFDKAHLTLTGAKLLKPVFAQVVKDLG